MKKRLVLTLVICLLFSTINTLVAEATTQEPSLTVSISPPSVQVNGSKINAPSPFRKDNVTWVPFRAIAEAYHFRVEWESETQTVTFIDYTGLTSYFIIDGITAVIVDGTTFVPYDFLAGLNLDDNNIMKRLGYSKEYISVIVNEDREIFRKLFDQPSETWNVREITRSLPYPAARRYWTAMASVEPIKSISIEYQFDEDNPYQGGNGLNPFYETVSENNALILFALVEDLEQVDFLHYSGDELNRTDSYTLDNLSERFGEVDPLEMDEAELYGAIFANIQTSEFYFAHYSRIYLGADFEAVSYRNGEPDEIKNQSDGLVIWTYNELGKSERILPSGEREISTPGYTSHYYFNTTLTEQNDSITGLYATKFSVVDGESYLELTAYLGFPTIIEDRAGTYKYIAYPLRNGQQKNAYFILQNDKIIWEGVMYGDDYTILDYGQ